MPLDRTARRSALAAVSAALLLHFGAESALAAPPSTHRNVTVVSNNDSDGNRALVKNGAARRNTTVISNNGSDGNVSEVDNSGSDGNVTVIGNNGRTSSRVEIGGGGTIVRVGG
ncbi:hypothetical protein SAMN04489726_1261 [Allokutzneria albata]|uniref:Curlin associated repeat-containing protein n=1 Tax=Allokutzneria albata TaxID=211114 RepID=A0A1G9SLW4_ALLAB|nr:hypothetical protein SAMN04489726_1261 [Allokutzneria albata]